MYVSLTVVKTQWLKCFIQLMILYIVTQVLHSISVRWAYLATPILSHTINSSFGDDVNPKERSSALQKVDITPVLLKPCSLEQGRTSLSTQCVVAVCAIPYQKPKLSTVPILVDAGRILITWVGTALVATRAT